MDDTPAVEAETPSALPTSEATLDVPLTEIDLPVRMLTVAQRLSLVTIRDLLRTPVATLTAQPNLGRRSIEVTQQLVADHLHMPWDDAVAQATTVAPGEGAPLHSLTNLRFWRDLAPALSETQRQVPVQSLTDLPARIRSYATREGIETLGELAARTSDDLLDAGNVGRKTIRDTLDAITAWAARGAVTPASYVEYTGLRALWQATTARCEQIDRIVLSHRAGLNGGAVTLTVLGDMLGVTRERVRQLEVRGVKIVSQTDGLWAQVEARLRSLLHAPVCAVDDVVREDPWFADFQTERGLTSFLFERVFEGRFNRFELGGVDVIGTVSDEELLAIRRMLLSRLAALHWPTAWAELEALVDHAAGELGGIVRGWLRDSVRQAVVFDDRDPSVVNGLGTTRTESLASLLRAAPGPVLIADLFREFGRSHLSRDVVFLKRGLVTHVDRLPGFDALAAKLVPRCARWMRAHGPTRQWSCEELVPVVVAEHELPTWFGAWPLAAMCGRRNEVRYVGRLAVVLPEVEGDRLHVVDAFIQVLRDAGGPLPEHELEARARMLRGFSPFTLVVSLQRRPFVEVAVDVWGLWDRDLPEGDAAAARAVEWTLEMLTLRGCGLTLRDVLSRLRGRSGAFDAWTDSMLRSVFRNDARLQTTVSGTVGLSEWQDARLPSRREIINQALTDGGGRVPIEVLQAKIAALYGEAPSRSALAWGAWGIGGRLSGLDLIRVDATAQHEALTSIPGIPPEAIPTFESLRALPAGDLDELSRDVELHTQRFFHEAVSCDAIDVTAAIAAQRKSRSLLAIYADATPEAQALISAAVRYYIHEGDGAWDFTEGGLDDDLEVLDAVRAHLGVEGETPAS